MVSNSMEQLPCELVSEILSRLPAKELVKCKLVSKSWFDIITDPYFVTNYYAVHNNRTLHSQKQEKHLLAIRRRFVSNVKTQIYVRTWNVNDPKKHVPVSSTLLNPHNEFNTDHKYWSEIMGPCNGIYFLEGNPNVMMNPSLRQFKALPESHFTDYSGFGFDTKTNDYKVVAIKDIGLKETDERRIGYWEAELYSLNSNSWRKLEPFPVGIWGSTRVYTFVNNCYHWWGFVNESGKTEDAVLAFDMVNEVFRKIKLPRLRDLNEVSFASLAPFDESSKIGVVVCPLRLNVEGIQVWVMKDYWAEDSWTKIYTLGPTEVIDKVLGFLGTDIEKRLSWHGLDSQKTRRLDVYEKYASVAIYKESLVSLQRENEFTRQVVSEKMENGLHQLIPLLMCLVVFIPCIVWLFFYGV